MNNRESHRLDQLTWHEHLWSTEQGAKQLSRDAVDRFRLTTFVSTRVNVTCENHLQGANIRGIIARSVARIRHDKHRIALFVQRHDVFTEPPSEDCYARLVIFVLCVADILA